MNAQIPILPLATLILALGSLAPAWAQGTAFTYQGRLSDNGAPANGSYDLRFEVRDAPSGGNAVGGAVTAAPVAVSNGVFTVTLDFGAGAFTGAARYLEIGVRTNGSVSAYTILAPRQPITAVPYALYAMTPAGPQGPAGLTGATGPQGARGLTFRGAWSSVVNYAADDAVFANGSAWLAKRANSGITPAAGDDWTLLGKRFWRWVLFRGAGAQVE